MYICIYIYIYIYVLQSSCDKIKYKVMMLLDVSNLVQILICISFLKIK